ncbi:hypothetical protein Pmar_PMAR029159 [Perkinsus marinus ATCC 50983]|uniref:Uncharacterized protein n=1 Tax=Perkinsus marinus (strain ATCC 50983 / TXsc) TaxID=423536 RepID=C5M0S8_PERM5|nr:hypothetical protein Pmar_PMAR029159 [Perkinsus marinus ATCC 50983]EEQ97436.1 hypothetical protein Pmar_PMAR029159 [Perkinsus marinus ATCC 50983]|eukprot:XP_002764719.1 hypothetical protein Pmar_PMAR029159 [Perkinsus marinus ATCC 50983]
MDLFSLAVSGFKAVQTVHTCYAKAKELHTLATKEIAVSVEKLAAALQCLQAPLRLAQLLHTRMPTSEAVSASVGLARQAVREAEELIDTIMSLESTDDGAKDASPKEEVGVGVIGAEEQARRLRDVIADVSLAAQMLTLGLTAVRAALPVTEGMETIIGRWDFDNLAFSEALTMMRQLDMGRTSSRGILLATGQLWKWRPGASTATKHKLLLEPQFFCSARLALSGKEEEVLATLTLAPIEDASEPSDVAETIQVVLTEEGLHDFRIRLPDVSSGALSLLATTDNTNDDVLERSLCFMWTDEESTCRYAFEFECCGSAKMTAEVFEMALYLSMARNSMEHPDLGIDQMEEEELRSFVLDRLKVVEPPGRVRRGSLLPAVTPAK